MLEIGHSSDTAEGASDAPWRRIPGVRAVDIASQRDAAERIALRVAGVYEVRDRLKVW